MSHFPTLSSLLLLLLLQRHAVESDPSWINPTVYSWTVQSHLDWQWPPRPCSCIPFSLQFPSDIFAYKSAIIYRFRSDDHHSNPSQTFFRDSSGIWWRWTFLWHSTPGPVATTIFTPRSHSPQKPKPKLIDLFSCHARVGWPSWGDFFFFFAIFAPVRNGLEKQRAWNSKTDKLKRKTILSICWNVTSIGLEEGKATHQSGGTNVREKGIIESHQFCINFNDNDTQSIKIKV